jgi:hypothetical protein
MITRNKSRLLIGTILLTFSLSLWALSYSPDTWSTCLDDSAEYFDGTPAPLSGYCNVVDTAIIENNEVEITHCQSSRAMSAGRCTANGSLRADTMD